MEANHETVDTVLEAVLAETYSVVQEHELKEKLANSRRSGKPLRIKFGIDPTNPHIHIGHLVPCRKLRLFQDLGHTAVIIIGDYTAQIGDPTGRNKERTGLTAEEVQRNMALYTEQLFTVVDGDRAEVRYQSEWMQDVDLSETMKLNSRFSVAHLLSHDTFRTRLDAGRRLSLHELMYPVLQAYDSVMVDADMELGGSDQLFNCLCGRDLQRGLGEDPQVVITTPLLAGTDGDKMSKSLNN